MNAITPPTIIDLEAIILTLRRNNTNLRIEKLVSNVSLLHFSQIFEIIL